MIRKFYFKIAMCCAMIWILILTGCSRDRTGAEKLTKLEYEETEKSKTEIYIESPETDTEPETDVFLPEPELVEADWSEYSDGLNGAAVIYDVSELRYTVYNRELALTQSSPCSTFKIISSLIALEQRIIPSEDSTRTWSGEVFWNEKWNRDIDFESSFRDSCVWYFRQVIDDIGQERMQEELYKLQYGNCDISDWEGRLNTNNNNRALTGFWIESSLAISPKEQTEVMERIFGTDSVYSEETQNRLRQVMLVTEQNQASASIYGKTGMGRANGSIDAWFTGFAEHGEKKVYFCVYLGKSDDENISSTAAKKIAIRLVTDYFKN
ncbi:MAG: class D beta-lactamase [Lachnospiraceae bacterium]|nr:class D beta-lactamase [Lachnospiraceae bacterium]